MAGVVVAGLAGTTSLIAASMLARLTRRRRAAGAGPRRLPLSRPRRLRDRCARADQRTAAGLYTGGIPLPALRKVS